MNKCIHASIKLAITSIKTPPSKANTLLLSIFATTLLAGCGGSEGDSNDDNGQVAPTVYSTPATASLGGKISPAINMVESGHATTFTVTPMPALTSQRTSAIKLNPSQAVTVHSITMSM